MKHCKELGSLKNNGYVRRNELLFQEIDDKGHLLCRQVLPVGYDFTGHIRVHRTGQLLILHGQGMGNDVL